jgi:hypothetical protein
MPKNGATINVMQKVIVVIGFIGESLIIIEDIVRLFSGTILWFGRYANRTGFPREILSVSCKAMRPECAQELNVKYNK